MMRDHQILDEFEPGEDNGFRFRGWHFLLILLAMFGVVFAANGIFLYHAVNSFPGETVPKSYLQGVEYNRQIEARERQAELGWRAAIGIVEARNGPELVARIDEADGSGASNLDVMAEVRRLATNQGARLIAMELSGNGEYRAPLGDIAAGAWEVRLEAFKPGENTAMFSAHKELVVE